MADTCPTCGHPQPEAVVLKHRPGRGSEVLPAEPNEIRRTYLTETGISKSALARRYGRDRGTIAEILSGTEFEQLEKDVQQQLAREATGVLRRGVVTTVRHQAPRNVAPVPDSARELGIRDASARPRAQRELVVNIARSKTTQKILTLAAIGCIRGATRGRQHGNPGCHRTWISTTHLGPRRSR